jgi:hypothetical protein
VSPVRYELGFYIPEDDMLHSHSSENLKSYKDISVCNGKEYRHVMNLCTSPYGLRHMEEFEELGDRMGEKIR